MLRALRSLVSQVLTAATADRVLLSLPGRVHLELRGVHRPGAQAAVGEVLAALRELDGVRRAEVLAPLGRVVVSFDRDRVSPTELAEALAEAEEAHGLAEAERVDPVLRQLGRGVAGPAVALAASVTGLGGALLAGRLPLPSVPALLTAAVSLAEATPRVRTALETALGAPAADRCLALGGTLAQTLARRPVGLLLDTAQRAVQLHAAWAQHRTWLTWEARHLAGAGSGPEGPVVAQPERSAPLLAGPAKQVEPPCPLLAGPVEQAERPVPLPAGPVEQTGDRLAATLVAIGAGALVMHRGRGLGLLTAAAPKAARAAREGFAAQLAAGAARRDALVLDGRALRRLDRVDTVLLDAELLCTGVRVVREVLPLDPGLDPAPLHEHADALLRDRATTNCWAMTPARRADLPAPQREALRHAGRDGAAVLLLRRERRAVALVSVVEEVHPLAESVVATARAAGTVVLAGRGGRVARQLGVDRVLPGGPRLAESVRTLQAEGRVVAAVSTHGGLTADVGIGVGPAWGAHICCPSLAAAAPLLAAIPLARKASSYGARLAVGGGAASALLTLLGPAASAPARAAVPVNLAALLALGLGLWQGRLTGLLPEPRPASRTPWHLLRADTVLDRLGSSPEGLTEDEARRRRTLAAQASPPEPDGLVAASAQELANPMTPVLAAGAAMSATVGAALDAVMIGGVLAVNAVIGGAQRVGANRALRGLSATARTPVGLWRAGTRRAERPEALVPGDVIELTAGDVVPADCRVLHASGLEVDEASLTGESHLVAKTATPTAARAVADRHCMLYEGTTIAAGTGRAVVVATGASTELGQADPTDRSVGARGEHGVHARLDALARLTLPLSVGAGGLLMLVDLARGRPAGASLGRAVSLAVAAVPEGLPFIATVAELAAARRLSRHGALVRDAATIETLGRATVLCFDKTGTLTQGRIALCEVSDGTGSQQLDRLDQSHRAVLAAALRASPQAADGSPLAHPTDRSVVQGAHRAGVSPGESVAGWEPLAELPFEPARGYHAALGRCAHGHRLSVKGAPEVVLDLCTTWRAEPLDKHARRAVKAEVNRLARAGYRVLAVAERVASARLGLDASRVRELNLLGLLALADPVRETAAAAVAQLRSAGVRVVMVTGDHPATATAIAAQLALPNGRSVMTGAELDALDEAALAARLPEIAVFARTSPAQKARITAALRAAGEVVAVTGDGANDAAAIRVADIGIALGSRATAAARHAADLVVTDDRIETITDAVVAGRAMWASVRDAVAILLGGNLGEIAFTVGAGLFGGRETLNARQLLLVNLLTDVLPAMAVAIRPPPKATPQSLLAEGPDAALGRALDRDIRLRATTTAGAAFAAWLLSRFTATPRQAATAALVALVAAQLGQTMATRGRTPLVLGAGAVSLAALIAVVQLPGLSQLFGCTPLLPHSWLISLGAATTATAMNLLWQR